MKNPKTYLILFLCILINAMSAWSQEEKQTKNWSSSSAYLIPAGRMEIGLFQPLSYGCSESIELSTHPLIFFLMPHITLKWSHSPLGKFLLTSNHSIYYPTLLLRTISRKGTGGIISPEFDIPHMFSIYNEIIVSRPIHKNHLATAKAGISMAIRFGDLDERTTIDLPLVYPRMAVYYHTYSLRFGSELYGKVILKWRYLINANIFFTPPADEKFAFEHKTLILWNKSDHFQLCLGYKLVYGEYPFGTQWHLLLPLFDLQWAWQLK